MYIKQINDEICEELNIQQKNNIVLENKEDSTHYRQKKKYGFLIKLCCSWEHLMFFRLEKHWLISRQGMVTLHPIG